MEHFWGVSTRWQLGDGGVSIPPWSVLGGAFGEAIESLESKGVREEALLGKPLEVYFGRRQRDRTRICICLTPVSCAPLCSDVGSLWSQGLEGISVNIGCGRECTRRLVFVGFRWGTIMVARIRSNFCQYLGSDVGPLWSQGLEATSVSIWAPMWDHCGRKD